MKFKNIAKYFVLLSRHNPFMLKGLKSVDLRIIQMYHFRLKWKRYTVCTKWWDSNFFGVGLPLFTVGLLTFCQMGVLNSCFQNPSESSVKENSKRLGETAHMHRLAWSFPAHTLTQNMEVDKGSDQVQDI